VLRAIPVENITVEYTEAPTGSKVFVLLGTGYNNMPDIFLKLNVTTGQVDVTIPTFEPNKLYWNIIHIKQGFFDETSGVVIFDNVSYGHKVYVKNIGEPDRLIHDKSYPQFGLKPVSTNLEYEESSTLYVDPESIYVVEAWYQNAGKFYRSSNEFLTPAPPDFESEFLVYHPDLENIPPEYEHPLPAGSLEQIPVADYETPSGAYVPVSPDLLEKTYIKHYKP
jgi:hypothetical protein